MEQIFQKLSEIDEAAQSVIEGADRAKQQLSLEMEEQMKACDQQLMKETEEKIAQIREGLEEKKDARLKELRKNTEEAIQALDAYYEREHEHLAKELFQKILDS